MPSRLEWRGSFIRSLREIAHTILRCCTCQLGTDDEPVCALFRASLLILARDSLRIRRAAHDHRCVDAFGTNREGPETLFAPSHKHLFEVLAYAVECVSLKKFSARTVTPIGHGGKPVFSDGPLTSP